MGDEITEGAALLVGWILGTVWTVAVFRAARRSFDAHARDALDLITQRDTHRDAE